ncbi:MAG: hypothetical protein LBF09_03825 [Odoribacteraceae bacterium]|jgi:hypothetical protein|nr:hypothetical protein [Odoribacteraceae bacterium]
MKTNVYPLLLTILLAACHSDDEGLLSPSLLDKDWLRVEDSTDPLDRARYEIYREHGISIFYSDTLGKLFRGINVYGDSIIHVEKLDPFYSVTGQDASTTYALSKNRDDLLDGVRFFKENILPTLLPAFYPGTVLLVGELTLNAFNTEDRGKRPGNVYNGYRTMILSNVGNVGNMSGDERRALTEDIAAATWYKYASARHAVSLELFFAVSEALYTPQPSQPSVYFMMISSGVTVNYKPHWYQYGFLESGPSMPGQLAPNPSVPGEYTRYYTPTRDEDAIMFFRAVFHYTPEEFDAEYGDVNGHELLRQKYDMIHAIVSTIKNTR